MLEKDLRIIQNEFWDIVGFSATAKISGLSADRSAGVIVELTKKIYEKKTQPIDLLRATIATSQLIERWSRLNQRLALGKISSIDDTETLQSVLDEFTSGNLPMKKVMRLTRISYVAKPSLGANKAIALLSRLMTVYPDISLQEPKS
jgi:hypothetical protein